MFLGLAPPAMRDAFIRVYLRLSAADYLLTFLGVPGTLAVQKTGHESPVTRHAFQATR